MKPPVVPDTWDVLRRYTPARIALGRSGVSLPTAPQLAFQLAHAQARDAVHRPWDIETSTRDLEGLGLPVLHAHSAASNRATYLQRPDLGRRLDVSSATLLQSAWDGTQRFDLGVVIADGLSALAVERHAAVFLQTLFACLKDTPAAAPWRLAPVVLVQQGRVAVGDEVGECLGLDMVIVLIGERPGLSSPDSMGLYLTWAPRVGCNDAQRNCISNIRPEGLNYADAAHRAAWLLSAARTRALTGVDLKDESAPAAAQLGLSTPGFSLTGASDV